MENNQQRGIFKTYLPLLFILFFQFCVSLKGQKISKFYKSFLQSNGVLYFVEPKQEFNNKKCKLIYDLTYLTTNDTISMNFTYYGDALIGIDSISFVRNNQRLSSNVKKIFVEPHKSFWEHRYSAKFSFTDFELFFNQKSKINALLFYDNKSLRLGIKEKKWIRQSAILSKILTLIKVNKKS